MTTEQKERDYLYELEWRVAAHNGSSHTPISDLVALCRKQQNEIDALRADVAALREDVTTPQAG